MKYELGDICEYSNDKINLEEINLDNYITTENMLANKKGIVKAKKLPNQKKIGLVERDNILISNIRPYFKKIWYSKFTGGCSNDILNIKVKNTLNIFPKFLYYTLCKDEFFEYMMMGNKGTKMPRGDKDHIMKYEIDIPSINIQKKIVKFLEIIDQKTSLNTQIINNLQKLSQELFKKWFIDFEFPDQKGRPYQSSGGKMIDSELGKIPKGWKVLPIEDIVKVNKRGYSPDYSKDGKGIPVINQRCIRNGIIIEEAIQFHDETRKQPPEDVFIKPYDILINSMGVGTLGRISQVGDLKCRKIIHSCISIIRADETIIDQGILGCAIKNRQCMIEQMGTGTTGQTSLNNKILGELKIIVPPIKVQNNLKNIIRTTLDQITLNYIENQNLELLRDTLLPKLMNGEINLDKIEI